MTWADAIDRAVSEGMWIPNMAQAEELNLIKCWTSTTPQKYTHRAIILSEPEPVRKSELRPVVMVSGTNYTLGTISHRTGDEGCGETKSES